MKAQLRAILFTLCVALLLSALLGPLIEYLVSNRVLPATWVYFAIGTPLGAYLSVKFYNPSL